MEFCLNINKKDINRNDIVIGSLLGDAHIQKDGRIEIWHSIKQKDYTLWLMNLFSKFFKVYYKERTCKFGKNIEKQYKQVGFRTSVTDYAKTVRMFFYCPKKTITERQLMKLTPLGLAIWYMDDGCLSFIKDKKKNIKARQLTISTQAYTYEENEIIVDYFKNVWNINCKIHHDREYPIIWMNGTEAMKFLNIIKDYIPDCMYYKLCPRYYGYKSDKNICGRKCENGNCPYNIV